MARANRLDRLLSDPAALDKLVIIYRPTYRQTLFVFGMGKVVLQTYPPSFFPRDAALLPTCTANKSQSDVRDVIRTMIRAHFFELPQKSYVETLLRAERKLARWRAAWLVGYEESRSALLGVSCQAAYKKSFDDDHGSGTFWTAETSGLGGGGSSGCRGVRHGLVGEQALTEGQRVARRGGSSSSRFIYKPW
jgi:hypothetical protein